MNETPRGGGERWLRQRRGVGDLIQAAESAAREDVFVPGQRGGRGGGGELRRRATGRRRVHRVVCVRLFLTLYIFFYSTIEYQSLYKL